LLTAIWKGTPVNFDPSAAVEPDEKGIDLWNIRYIKGEGGSGEITYLNPEVVENATETLKLILPITIDKWFELFYADEAAYPPEALYKDVILHN
jgi:hypothetical protein